MADVAEDEGSMQKPRWFTPGRLLLIFCITNLVVYLDRGRKSLLCCAAVWVAYACYKLIKSLSVCSPYAGVIASNGVNGSPRTEQQPQGSGIQVQNCSNCSISSRAKQQEQQLGSEDTGTSCYCTDS
jgi:hypothetical protein